MNYKYGLSFEGSIGDFIKALRKGKNINSVDLAKSLGKSSAYISQIEKGRNKNPDYKILCEILKQLGISDDERIEGYLAHFGYISPEALQAEEEYIKGQIELAEDEVYQEQLNTELAERYEQEQQLNIEEANINKKINNWLSINKKPFESYSDVFDLQTDIIDANIREITNILLDISDYKNYSENFDFITGLNKALSETKTNEKLYKFLILFFSTKIHLLDNGGMINVINTLYTELNRIQRERTVFGTPNQQKLIDKI